MRVHGSSGRVIVSYCCSCSAAYISMSTSNVVTFRLLDSTHFSYKRTVQCKNQLIRLYLQQRRAARTQVWSTGAQSTLLPFRHFHLR